MRIESTRLVACAYCDELIMATCGSVSSAVSVCCPVCYREYSEDSDLVPRILHCGHSFCTECLRRLLDVEGEGREDEDEGDFALAAEGGRDLRLGLLTSYWGRRILDSHPLNDQLTCPVCKRTNHVQEGEVGNLTKNFALLSVQEGAERSSQHYCQEHDHEQRIYCQECQQLVCAYCQLYGRHKTHKCLIASEACEPAVQAVRELESEVEGQLRDLEAGEAAVLGSIQELESGRARSERRIRLYFSRFIEALQQKMEAEVERVQSWSDDQAGVLQAQLRSLSGARKGCQRLLEDCRRISDRDPLQALVEQEPLSSRAEDVKAVCGGLPREPIISPSIWCEGSTGPAAGHHLESLLEGLSVSMSLDPGKPNEEEEEEHPAPLHAQDTEHLTESPMKLDSTFPAVPLATPSSPTCYITYDTSAAALYCTQGNAQSPCSSTSDTSLPDGADEFKHLPLRPLALPMWLYCHQPLQRAHEDSAELADDESDPDLLFDHLLPLPPLSLPQILPGHSHLAEDDHEVNVSIAGQGLHISVSSSTWDPTVSPSILLDSGEPATADDSD